LNGFTEMPRDIAGGKRPIHASDDPTWIAEIRRLNVHLDQIARDRSLQDHDDDDERLKVLTVREAAKLLRVSATSAYAAVRSGAIPAVKIGGRIVIPRAGLVRLLEPMPP
jgi:excisionase family DNA binding protein